MLREQGQCMVEPLILGLNYQLTTPAADLKLTTNNLKLLTVKGRIPEC